MSSRLGLLTAVLSLVAAGAAGAAYWQAREATDAARRSAAFAVRPMLTLEADKRPGSGLRITNIGVGPASVISVKLAMARADGTLDWLGYPAADNNAQMNLWEFVGLPEVNVGLPEGQAAIATAPQAGMIWPVGTGLDLIRFPAGTVLPAEWTAKNGTKADAALNGLMVCLDYVALDDSVYQLDRGGLCKRPLTDADHRYTGSK